MSTQAELIEPLRNAIALEEAALICDHRYDDAKLADVKTFALSAIMPDWMLDDMRSLQLIILWQRLKRAEKRELEQLRKENT